jgi:HAD superfamily hydrolase (TIGR01484 family)
MTSVRLVAFDLDDTLAPSKSPIDPRMSKLLIELASHVEIAIISGGTIRQFQHQVLDHLDGASHDVLSQFHLLPTCGTQYYRVRAHGLDLIYSRQLSDAQRTRAMEALEGEARRLGIWESSTWGDVLEDRGSQITFSALGQEAPVAEKAAWDPDGQKRENLRIAVANALPDLEVRSGGSTSLDVTEYGIDKAFGMENLRGHTNIDFNDMLFVGDRLVPGGNDYPVFELGIACRSVHGWADTADYLDTLIAALKVDSGSYVA